MRIWTISCTIWWIIYSFDRITFSWPYELNGWIPRILTWLGPLWPLNLNQGQLFLISIFGRFCKTVIIIDLSETFFIKYWTDNKDLACVKILREILFGKALIADFFDIADRLSAIVRWIVHVAKCNDKKFWSKKSDEVV